MKIKWTSIHRTTLPAHPVKTQQSHSSFLAAQISTDFTRKKPRQKS